MASFLLSIYDKAMAKHSAILKKQETVQRDIDKIDLAFKRDIDGDKGIKQWRSEVIVQTSKHDRSITDLDDKLESKTRVLQDKLEADKKALEDKYDLAKKAVVSRYDAEKTRLDSLIVDKMKTIEESAPDSLAYRKLKAEKELLQADEEKARDEMLDAQYQYQVAQQKAMEALKRDSEFKERQYYAKKQREEEAARQEIEARKEREAQEAQRKFDEALARAPSRVVVTPSTEPVDYVKMSIDSLETALPQKKIRPTRKGKKLNIEELKKGQVYHIEDLETIDTDNLTDEQIELFDDLWNSACKLDGIVGCRKVDK